MIETKKLLIIGAYGTGNVGDEALLSGLLNLLLKTGQFKDEERKDVIVFSRDPQETIMLHGINAKRKNLFDFFIANELIFGGGELFQDRGLMAIKYSFLTLVAKFLRKKVTFVGVGVSGISSFFGKFLTKISFYVVDNVSVRNNKSKNNLFDLGVYRKILVEPDLSFYVNAVSREEAISLLESEKIVLDPNNFVVGIVFQYVPSSNSVEKELTNDLVKSFFLNFSKKILEDSNVQIIFLPFNRHKDKDYDDDVIYGKEIQKNLINERFSVVTKLFGPKELKGVIKLFDIIVSTRLHPLAFANSVGVPCVGVEVFEKVKSFCDDNNIPTVNLSDFDKLFSLYESMIQN